MNDCVNSANFNKKLNNIFKTKEGKNIVKGRFDIEPIQLRYKADFLVSFVGSYKEIFGITYRILFWEKDEILKDFFNINFPAKQYRLDKTYKNGKIPGSIFVDEQSIDKIFLKILLDNHFNFEMAEKPSLNMRVQMCINTKDFIVLLDIYDDRGFYMYCLN